MVSLSPWTKKSGGCREVAVIAEVRDETGYNGNLQQAIVLVFLVTVSMQSAVYIYIFPCF